MIQDFKPILFATDPAFDCIELYFAHDIHFGSELADMQRWERFKADIKAAPNRFLVWVGDYCETALINSRSSIYSQQAAIEEQRIWMEQQFYELKDRTIAIVPGNHENRITKAVGLYPVYDAAVAAGVADRYRQHFAFADIAVGSGGHGAGKQTHYVGYVAHKLKDFKGYHGGDFVDGVDFVACGHDHDPKDHARCKLVYDSKNKSVFQKSIEIIDSGSFLRYGGYGADAGYRPQSEKAYKLVLPYKKAAGLKTIGFYI